MAASDEQFEQLLRCGVCLDRLNCPKILPCQHTFCKAPCIEGLIDWGARKLKCPECRQEHFVPRDGAEGFPNNITITGFLDLPANSSRQGNAASPQADANAAGAASARQCGVCEAEAEGLVKCFHCSKMVCGGCKQAHTGQMKLDIGRLINQIRRGMPKLSEAISHVEGRSEAVKQQVEGVKSDIHRVFESYIRELQEREKLLTSELDTFQQGELRGLRLQQENFEVELASISSYCDSTESLLNQSSATPIPEADMVTMRSQCAEYMNQIRQTETQSIAQPRTAAFRSDGSHIHANIRNLGEVTVTTPGSQRARNVTQPPAPRQTTTTVTRTTATTTAPTRHSHPEPAVRAIDRSPDRRPTNSSNFHPTRFTEDFYRNFGLEPEDGRTEASQDRRNRSHPYMYQMAPTLDRANEYWRRQYEAQNNRQRVNAVSIFGPSPFEEGPEPETGFSDGRDRDRIPRRPIRNWTDDRPVGVAGGAAGRGGALTTGTSNSHGASSAPASVPHRPGAAFLVPLDRATPVELTRNAATVNATTNNNTATTTTAARNTSPRRTQATRIGGGGGGGGAANRGGGTGAGGGTGGGGGGAGNRVGGGGGGGGGNDGARNRDRSNNNNRTNNNHSNNPRTERNRAQNRSERPTRAERNQNRSEARDATDSQDPESNTRRIRPGTVVLSRREQPRPVDRGTENQNNNSSNDSSPNGSVHSSPSISNQGSPNSTQSSNDNQNNATGDITLRSQSSMAAPSDHTNSESTTQEINEALNETLGDLLIESDEEDEEVNETVINAQDIPNPQDSLSVTNAMVRYDLKGAPTREIGGVRGNAPGEFACPRGIGICPVSGSIVVADSSNHRVQIFSSAGEVIHHFGNYGQFIGEFDCLAGIAVNLMGEIIVADRYNHRIQVFDRYGTFSHQFGREGTGDGDLNFPWGVACDRSGFIYVCDKENHRIQMFQENGTFVRSISRLGADESELENPHYVAITDDNFIIVSDTNNHRIQIFTTTGRLVKCFGREGSNDGELRQPKGVAVDNQGFIIVADSGNHRVQVFRGDGRFYGKFGSEGTEPGQFKEMEGLAVMSDGRVVVSDTELHRVQIF